MRSTSIKALALALTLAATLSTAPTQAATRQNRDRDNSSSPVTRLVQRVLHFIGMFEDVIIAPHP